MIKEGKAGFQLEDITWQRDNLNSQVQLCHSSGHQVCPECSSVLTWRDGIRHTKSGQVQRYLCRNCGYRFSESKVELNISRQVLKRSDPHNDLSHDVVASLNPSLEKSFDDFSLPSCEDVGSHNRTIIGQPLNNLRDYTSTSRVCVSKRESKNLTEVETRIKEGLAGATEITDAEVKGKIIEFLWWLKKQGYKPDTIQTRVKRIRRLAKLRANLFNPEDVKEVIARQNNWCDGTKAVAIVAYNSFLKMLRKTWYPLKYKIREKLPFIPLETEVDALINSCGKKMACFLQGLKDTGADPGELAQLEWTNINYNAKSVTIRHPVKGHSSRVVRVSDLFLRRLSVMPKKNNRIFCNYRGLASNFYQQRKRCARDMSNPRILKITFITLRHWKGTMEYHKTKDILHVKRILGHKSVQNTMIYINLEATLFQIRSDQFTVRVAHTLDEACKLIEAGFGYVTDMEGDKIFRKRK